MPDLPDNRDHLYSAPLAKLRVLPTKADLRRRCPKVYNQGQIGSCTANAIAAAIEFERFMVRNSWGSRWGKRGYSIMPYSYLLTDNLSDDFWTIPVVH
jgi:C1A family cysteine protease